MKNRNVPAHSGNCASDNSIGKFGNAPAARRQTFPPSKVRTGAVDEKSLKAIHLLSRTRAALRALNLRPNVRSSLGQPLIIVIIPLLYRWAICWAAAGCCVHRTAHNLHPRQHNALHNSILIQTWNVLGNRQINSVMMTMFAKMLRISERAMAACLFRVRHRRKIVLHLKCIQPHCSKDSARL